MHLNFACVTGSSFVFRQETKASLTVGQTLTKLDQWILTLSASKSSIVQVLQGGLVKESLQLSVCPI